MLFRQLFDPETSTYSYLVADPDTREAILVDPVLEQVERDTRLLREFGLTLRYCLETHVHADHVTGTAKLRELTGCQGIVPVNALVACADRTLGHGEVLPVGAIEIKAITTLGHTDSHNSYLINGDRVLTGDSLLFRGCGRTDFQNGDAGTMYDHVTGRLFTLPDETLVYAGHDYKGFTVSTIGEEKQFNPRFVGHTRESFIELMGNLNLPDPKKIAEAVPANRRCGNVA
ncbi:MBL fold metallo-hydrolase [Pannus brasiliensis CCIBt3594]|uniref:MBL fold metallo-hydrolase n=1 Tax=Pannus brasiliensis CCIBt3594 TaxID=1427578 RepID=A0AAW9QZ53_9CHRO